MTLEAELKVEVSPRLRGANDFDTGGLIAPTVRQILTLTDGTAAGKADLLFVDERTVAESTDDDLDLAGSLADPFGNTLTFVELVALLVINAPIAGAANASDLSIGGGTNPFLGFLSGTTPVITPIKPGGVFFLAASDAAGIGTVTASTADILRISNGSGGAATYQIAILGRSA